MARELAALAQSGLHYTDNEYERERYQRVREIAVEMLSSVSAIPRQDILDWTKADFGYATPKVDVRAFVLQDGKVLLIREDADGGRWTLPGGWADVNDTPSESVIREVEEESGYEVRPVRLLAVLDRERQGHVPPYPVHIYKLFFLCEITGGAPRATAESSESRFFGRDEIPELSLSRVLPAQLERFFDAVERGELAAAFD